ncbi:MAG: hypothetical protein BMS9Abin23_0358 [Thermodesulfobacteriota bacterium]|nr:MAG: hypothetical protein BMS9Abin23_0358 [Thermodesulfobacteriota bacterium]
MVERTCIACRAVFDKKALVRLVIIEGRLVPDFKGVLSGRGAYICPKRSCVERAFKRKGAFHGAFRRAVELPQMEELWRSMEDGVRRSPV